MSKNMPLVPGKAPFDYGLFFGAVRYYIGEPDQKSNLGFNGFYDYFWSLTNENRKKKIQEAFPDLQRMMKAFDLKFPESRCDVGKWEISPKPNDLYLRITVMHVVADKE